MVNSKAGSMGRHWEDCLAEWMVRSWAVQRVVRSEKHLVVR